MSPTSALARVPEDSGAFYANTKEPARDEAGPFAPPLVRPPGLRLVTTDNGNDDGNDDADAARPAQRPGGRRRYEQPGAAPMSDERGALIYEMRAELGALREAMTRIANDTDRLRRETERRFERLEKSAEDRLTTHVREAKESLARLDQRFEAYVTRERMDDRMKNIERIVYGACGLILIAFIGVVIKLVIA